MKPPHSSTATALSGIILASLALADTTEAPNAANDVTATAKIPVTMGEPAWPFSLRVTTAEDHQEGNVNFTGVRTRYTLVWDTGDTLETALQNYQNFTFGPGDERPQLCAGVPRYLDLGSYIKYGYGSFTDENGEKEAPGSCIGALGEDCVRELTTYKSHFYSNASSNSTDSCGSEAWYTPAACEGKFQSRLDVDRESPIQLFTHRADSH